MNSAFGATISISNYGAVGNGVADDSAAIQKAINSSATGDTILFPAGTYWISRSIALANSRTYQGQGATIKRKTGDFIFVAPYNAAANITITGLIFDGGGINMDGSGNPASNVKVTGCTFQNILSTTTWTNHNGILISGLNNGVIAQNRFSNILQGGDISTTDTLANGIMAYRLSNVSITDNVFDYVNQGMSLQFNGKGPYPGVVVARNVGTRIHRMGIETQGSYTTGMVVESNKFTNFLNPYWNTFGMSIVVDGGSDTIIRNNTVDAYPAATTGGRYGYGLEVSGTRTQVTGNTVRNAFWWGIAIGHAPNIVVTGNYLCGSSGAMTIGYEVGAQPGAQISGNTTAATCSTTSTPTASVTQPAPNTVLSGTVQLSAQASAPAGLKCVRFVLNGSQVLGDDYSSPYTLSVDTSQITDGSYSLQAIAIDSASTQGTSSPVPIQIRNGTVIGSIPTQGLKLWLKAGTGLTLQNSRVAQWSDQSGSGIVATQSDTTRQPLYVTQVVNALPVVRFAGQSLSFPMSINGLTGMTIILVGSAAVDQNGGSSKSEGAAIFWNETAWWGTTYLSPFQTNIPYRFGTTQTYNWPQYYRPASIGTKFSVSTSIKNGTTDSLYVNSYLTLAESGKLGSINGAVSTGLIGQGYNNTYFRGDIAEILVYNRALSDTERQAAEAFLLNKYAIK